MKKWYTKIALHKQKLLAKLRDNSGQGALDTAVVVLISIVLGALILAGLYALLDDTVLFSSPRKHDRCCYA